MSPQQEREKWLKVRTAGCRRWEYVISHESFLTTARQTAWLNEMGASGWELVNREKEGAEYIFKRPLMD